MSIYRNGIRKEIEIHVHTASRAKARTCGPPEAENPGVD
jgi:hypothetical protein